MAAPALAASGAPPTPAVGTACKLPGNSAQGCADVFAGLPGLDPNKAVFFRQSDVPEVTELAWMLACVTNMGLLERATSYKDKVDKGIEASMGLQAGGQGEIRLDRLGRVL